MAFCASCGNNVTGTFCDKCGAQVSGASGSSTTATAPATSSGISDNVASALCYLAGLITGVIFLVVSPYNTNPRIRFHAFQSIFFHIAFIVIGFGGVILTTILATIVSTMSGILGLLVSSLSMLIWLGGFLCWVFLMYKAYNGEQYTLPVIGPMAQAQASK